MPTATKQEIEQQKKSIKATLKGLRLEFRSLDIAFWKAHELGDGTEVAFGEKITSIKEQMNELYNEYWELHYLILTIK